MVGCIFFCSGYMGQSYLSKLHKIILDIISSIRGMLEWPRSFFFLSQVTDVSVRFPHLFCSNMWQRATSKCVLVLFPFKSRKYCDGVSAPLKSTYKGSETVYVHQSRSLQLNLPEFDTV